MSVTKRNKINNLLQKLSPGTAVLSQWLTRQGYSYSLQQQYRQSGWLEPIAPGVMKRAGDTLTWPGALNTLQSQAGLPVHIGGISSLQWHGLAQYLPMGNAPVYLFMPKGTKLPKWFVEWGGKKFKVFHTDFLSPAIGLSTEPVEHFNLFMSTPIRAFLELLYLAKDAHSLIEAYQIMEHLTTLRPQRIQELLLQCRSIKVLRLFLFMAEKAGHTWYKYLDISVLDLGKGKRQLVANGTFISKFNITIPKGLA